MTKVVKKGFTLIELLAIILILGIIALIAIPMVSNIIKDSKKNIFGTSVDNIAKVIEDECQLQSARNEAITEKYLFVNGEISPAIDIKGSLPQDGTATVDEDCNVTINATNGSFTATKTPTDTKTVVVDENKLNRATVIFSTNGNSKYSKSASTKVTISDKIGLNESSLKYLWNTSLDIPDENSFTNEFANEETLNSPSNANGKYYLWILVKDIKGNTTITRTSVFYIDSTNPNIKLNGNSPVNINLNDVYVDEGATVTDNIDKDIELITTGTVNPSIAGTYEMTYSAKDEAGNEASVSREVNVIDSIKPTIAFGTNGNSTYSKMGSTSVSVSDNGMIDENSLMYLWNTSTVEPSEDSFTTKFTNESTIKTPNNLTGAYYLWIIAKDKSGNTTVARSNVFNLDNVPPTIILNGSTSVTINKGSTYTDAGATASDNIDGIMPVTITGTVIPDVIGTYTITYNATDASGNKAAQVVRIVNVVDVSAPVITMLGSNPVNINIGGSYIDPGATALDDVDGDVTSKITITTTINVNVVGSYTVTYTVKDKANNLSTATRTVNVLDNIIPTVSFGTNGNSTYAKSRSTTVTVSDNVSVNNSSLKYLWNTSTTTPSEASFSSSFTNGATISSPVVSGTYYLWILAKDSSGNTAITRTNLFNLDNIAPVITLNGYSPIGVEQNSSYTDAGATATDNIDGTITGKIVTVSNVVTTTTGNYTITYNITDTAGNTAQVVRSVNVVSYIPIYVQAQLSSVATGSIVNINGTYYTLKVNSSYKLMNNISLTGTWTPIASSTTPFTGTFNGNSYTVSNIYLTDDASTAFLGLFAYNSGNIKNLIVSGTIAQSTSALDISMGVLAGYNSGTVTNCTSLGTVTSTSTSTTQQKYSGGLLGQSSGGTVTDSSSSVSLTISNGRPIVGGLIGFNTGSILSSSATGKIEAVATQTNSNYGTFGGGLVGRDSGNIIYSFATGSVSVTAPMDARAGGLVGLENGNIYSSYALGAVTSAKTSTLSNGAANSGGLVGATCCSGNYIYNSYASGNISASYVGDTYIAAGGLIGMISGTYIYNSYSYSTYIAGIGYADDFSLAGGLIGENFDGTISNSFWNSDANITRAGKVYNYGYGDNIGGNITYLVGLTSNQMLGTATPSFIGYNGTTYNNMLTALNTYVSGSGISNLATWGRSGSYNNGYPYLIGVTK